MAIFGRTSRAVRKWRNVDEPVALAARDMLEQTLRPQGWAKSVLSGRSEDLHGPIPWYTYAARMVLERCVPCGARVLEFGSGGSTRWWADRGCTVVAIEHDPAWHAQFLATEAAAGLDIRLRPAEIASADPAAAEQVRKWAGALAPAQAETQLKTAGPSEALDEMLAYAAEGLSSKAGGFDVVVIDGVARNLCARVALECVKPGGLVVFDNAERPQYEPGHALLAAAGLVRVDFWGPGPINPYPWTTALYAGSIEALRAKR